MNDRTGYPVFPAQHEDNKIPKLEDKAVQKDDPVHQSTSPPVQTDETVQKPLIDKTEFQSVLITKEGEPTYIPFPQILI